MPSQSSLPKASFFSNIPTSSAAIPWYIRLWASVVRRAAVDWVLYKDHKKAKFRKIGADAGKWIFREGESNEEGSFTFICDNLDLDSSLVRAKIKALTEESARKLRGMEFGDDS